jgi:hypothetical protein
VPNIQPLTAEDLDCYGDPVLIELCPPATADDRSNRKRVDWIAWRAAPYPAERHSEYLLFPEDHETPRIMLSAMLALPESLDAYVRGDDRKKKQRYTVGGRRAMSKGYVYGAIAPAEYAADIYAIVHSSQERQGRAIVSRYSGRPPNWDFSEYRPYIDPNYRDICTGVFDSNGTLVAYLLGKRVGEHVQYDEIMGHHDHLANDVMYLLHLGFVDQCLREENPPLHLQYGAWYSGVDPFSSKGGLNKWRRRIGFRPAYLKLACS